MDKSEQGQWGHRGERQERQAVINKTEMEMERGRVAKESDGGAKQEEITV